MIAKKEFEAIAELLNEHAFDRYEQRLTDGVFYICLDMSHLFASLNPNFDHDKFMNACGFTDERINEWMQERRGDRYPTAEAFDRSVRNDS